MRSTVYGTSTASFPEHAVLLLDTYDTLAALDNVISAGLRPAGVRLDSGDLIAFPRRCGSFLEEVSRVGGALSTVADLIGSMLRQPAA